MGKLLEAERAREAGQWVLQVLGVHRTAKERGMSGAEQSRERGGENGRRKRKELTGGSGLSVARGALLAVGLRSCVIGRRACGGKGLLCWAWRLAG